jgi:hypothetical protein
MVAVAVPRGLEDAGDYADLDERARGEWHVDLLAAVPESCAHAASWEGGTGRPMPVLNSPDGRASTRRPRFALG